MQYNWQSNQWPHFTYELKKKCQETLDAYTKNKLRLQRLTPHRLLALHSLWLDLRLIEAQKTCEIEGKIIPAHEISLGIQKHMEAGGAIHQKGQNVAAFVMNAQQTFEKPPTEAMLHQWYKQLTGNRTVKWRREDIKIVVGLKERVSIQLLPPKQITGELQHFINWFNASSHEPAPVKAAIAYVYFKSINPYDQCNGPIARALVEKILSMEMGFFAPACLSLTLTKYRKLYDKKLRENQIGMNVSTWIEFFIEIIYESQLNAQRQIQYILYKGEFWKKHYHELNNRQLVAINKMMTKGPEGIEGGMGARLYMQVSCCAKSTASKDLTDLVKKKCILSHGQSSSTRYTLAFLEPEYIDGSF